MSYDTVIGVSQTIDKLVINSSYYELGSFPHNSTHSLTVIYSIE